MKHLLLRVTLALVFVLMLAVAVFLPGSLAAESHQPVSQDYIPGVTYWGRNNYIEYVAGDLPIIISAPHGGYLKPAEIRNRRYGNKENDSKSQEYAREVAAYLEQLTGKRPHLIINHLQRVKLDPNRSIEEAAQGDLAAEQAWSEFHGFIEAAKTTITAQCGRGIYLDFHTGGHSKEILVELGYGLSGPALARTDEQLNQPNYINKSTLKSLAYRPGIYFPAIIRGSTSLGALVQAEGYPTIPSPIYPYPNGNQYFPGDYDIREHSSLKGGSIDGIQVETAATLLRDTVRADYAFALAKSITAFYEQYYVCLESHTPPVASIATVYLPIIWKTRLRSD